MSRVKSIEPQDMTVGLTAELPYHQRALLARQRRERQMPDKYRIPPDKMPAADVEDVHDFAITSGLFTEQELEITSVHAQTIVQNIEAGRWTALDVAKAFSHRAAVAQQLLNCLSEMLFEDAEDQARRLDEEFARTGKLKGPLHGVPVSLKDHIQYKGATTGVGYTAWALDVANEDAALVEVIRDLGGVLYCKTCVPVAMMMPDTDSHIFGPTLNPYNRKHSPGGSSGGESALIAFGASIFGFGSDVGGSVRIPASFTGVYGIRASAGRFPMTGCRSGLQGQHTIKSVVSPLARTAEDLEYISKAILSSRPERFDEHCLPIPWRNVELPEKLVFGYMRSDKYVEPTPAVVRAVDETVAALKRAGHEVIEWEPYRNGEIDVLADKVFTADGAKFVTDVKKDEPYFPYMEAYGRAKDRPSSELWAYQRFILETQKEVTRRWMSTASQTQSGRVVDAIIMPATPMSSHRPHLFTYVGYTSYWSVLDYPAVVLPVLRADAKIDGKPAHEPHSEKDRKTWADYDPKESGGGLVGVQLVCRRYEDEKAIKLAALVSEALKTQSSPS